MRKAVVIGVLLAMVGAGAWYYRSAGEDTAAASSQQPGGGGPGRGGMGGRQPMPVEMAPASRQDVVDYVTVVGNLIGEATVDIVPRVAGRIDAISVKLGDRVAKGQIVAKIEDRMIKEQINQATANLEVNKANVGQRDNDAKLAESIFKRMKLQDERGLISRQNLEDAEAKYNAAVSQVSVARSQVTQTQARLDELKITLSDTTVLSPVDGFVSRRHLDQGAFAGANTVILSVVDLSTVRMVANLVEKDFKRVQAGVEAQVEVDAFPGEQFRGQVSRVAPAFDPATRTASMEIEVPNPGFRLKPGLYARVRLTVDKRPNALTVPRSAVVDVEGKRGVYLLDNQVARFKEVRTGVQDAERVEILDGLADGQQVVTFGAVALRDGDRISVIGQEPRQTNGPDSGRSRGAGRRGGGQPPSGR